MSDHQPLPVTGYTTQPDENVVLVNAFKAREETILRALDLLRASEDVDQRWLAIGRSRLEEAFMAIVRSVFKPQRVALATD